jgi:hypothetical protein
LQYPPDPKVGKAGRPKGRAGRFKTRKVRSKLDLIEPMGAPKLARMARKRKRRVAPFPTFCGAI